MIMKFHVIAMAIWWLAWNFHVSLAVAQVQAKVDQRIIDVLAVEALPTTWPDNPDIIRLRLLVASVTGFGDLERMRDQLKEIDPGSPSVRN